MSAGEAAQGDDHHGTLNGASRGVRQEEAFWPARSLTGKDRDKTPNSQGADAATQQKAHAGQSRHANLVRRLISRLIAQWHGVVNRGD